MLKLHRLLVVTTTAVLVLILSLSIVELVGILREEVELRYVATDSMYPSIPRNSIVLILDSDGWDYSIGDIVFFNYCLMGRCIPVLHRVIDIDKNGIVITRGDNRVTLERVERENIVGRFIAGAPYLYGVVQFISFDVVAVAIIATIVILLPEFLPRKKTTSIRREGMV